MEELRVWKKAFESDLKSVSYELNEIIKEPCLVFLEGEVGEGKTTFVREFLASTCNYSFQDISSPTYSVVNDYGRILHVDLYRVENVEELIPLELPLYFEGKEMIFIEWGMRYFHFIKQLLDESFEIYQLKISSQNPLTRDYSLYLLER